MEGLHHDIVLDILLRLPHQSIINCKLVCKPWRDLLSNTKLGLLFHVGMDMFSRFSGLPPPLSRLCHGGQEYDNIDINRCYSYTTLAKFDNHTSSPPDNLKYQLVASCNGLVCFSLEYYFMMYDPTYICNPVTGEYVHLPRYMLSDDGDMFSKGSLYNGFGYNYETDEYKVVRMYARNDYVSSADMSLKVQVYTLGRGLGWRDIGTVNDLLLTVKSSAVFANGALHWVEILKPEIVAFDLADEKFIMIPLPPASYEILNEHTLKLLGGYLSVVQVDIIEEGEATFINVWSLKKKKKCNSYDMGGGDDDFENYWNWNKEFTLPFDHTKAKYYTLYRPFAITKTNQVLLWVEGHILSCYDANTNTSTQL